MIKRFVAGDVAGDNEGVSESPAVSLMAGDYQGIIAVVGDMIGWCERAGRPRDADLWKSITSDPSRWVPYRVGVMAGVGRC